MAYSALPTDPNGIPFSSLYVPGVGWIALQGAIVSTDSLGNQSAVVAIGHTTATILSLASSARSSYSSGALAVGQYVELALDLNVTVLTGGTSPTVTFKLSRLDANGRLYQLYLPTAISAAGSFSTSIGSGLTVNSSFGTQVQLDMVTTGSPTSITFSGSLIGK